jgi:hypothetical protein
MLGLAGAFFAAAVVFWVNDPGTSGQRPLPKDPVLALRPIAGCHAHALRVSMFGSNDRMLTRSA